MSFIKLTPSKYPPRQWGLYGLPDVGKSTFAAQMAAPLMVIDSDHRFVEVTRLATGDVYKLSDNPADHITVEAIVRQLRANMPSSGVKTLVIDSLTAIITPLVVEAIMDNDAGRNKNRATAFKSKALAMRLLQDAVTSWGTDCLWIYHAREGLDASARFVESTSISAVELARHRRSLNMSLRIDDANGKHTVTVMWARRGRYPITLDDTTGAWIGMPERIEAAVYGGLSDDDQQAIEKAAPTSFSGPVDAIAWGFEQGVFRDAAHARNAYEALKREESPASAREMWDSWIKNVQNRSKEISASTSEVVGPMPDAAANP